MKKLSLFLWKIFIFGGKIFRDISFYYFRRQKLSRKWTKIANVAKVSAPKIVSAKVYLKPCGAFVTKLDIKKILMINFKKVLVNQIGSIPISFSVMKLKFIVWFCQRSYFTCLFFIYPRVCMNWRWCITHTFDMTDNLTTHIL